MDELSKSYDEETDSMTWAAFMALIVFCIFVLGNFAAIIWLYCT